MKIEFRELISNGYTLRGLFSKPESEYKDLVVMLHGFTGHKNENGYLFKQLTQTLTDNQIATLRYDFMGSGESDGNFEDFTFFTELEDAKHIIEEAFRLNNNRKIILLGFSMGGAVASRISLEMKEYITKLILLSPAGNIAKLIHGRFENHFIDENGNIYINGELLEENYGAETIQNPGRAAKPITLGDDEYFVMGDNRNNSKDSRSEEVGNVKRSQIIGRAWLRIWPLNKFGLLKHQ